MAALVVTIEQQNLWVDVVINRDSDLDYSISDDPWHVYKVETI
jgi:hypothetical protein